MARSAVAGRALRMKLPPRAHLGPGAGLMIRTMLPLLPLMGSSLAENTYDGCKLGWRPYEFTLENSTCLPSVRSPLQTLSLLTRRPLT